MIYRLLKLNRMIRSHRLKYLAVVGARLTGVRHLSVRLDPVVGCNLSCLMCPFTARRRREAVFPRKFSPVELNRLGHMFFRRALQLVIGCSYEPTLYTGLEDIVELGKKFGVPRVGLTTNGQLLTMDCMTGLAAAGLDEITISTHGVEPGTYERLMAGASFGRLLEALDIITEVRRARGPRRPELRLNFTVCLQNLDEMPRLLEVFGRFGPDVLQVRPMFGRDYNHGLMAEGDLGRYLEYSEELIRDCRQRGITLLISRDDPRFERVNYNTLVMPAVYVYADPERVWRDDFDWRNETYEEYCRRTGFVKQLWRSIFSDRKTLLESARRFADSAGYEVIRQRR